MQEIIDYVYLKLKELVDHWHECTLSQIRLKTSNQKIIADYKLNSIKNLEKNKRNFKAPRQSTPTRTGPPKII